MSTREIKDTAERVKDCIELRSKLKYFGLDEYEELKPYVDRMNAYVRTGEYSEGTIILPTIQRKFTYKLTADVGKECTIVLKKIST